jgi:hypothetical protein
MQRSPESQALIEQLVVGSTLLGVEYEQLARGGLAAPPTSSIHEIDTAVYLRLDTGGVCLTWNHFDRSEALDVYPANIPDAAGEDTVFIEASENPSWVSIIRHQILALDFGWNYGEPDGPDDLWSVRLSFRGGGFVVICMGELDRTGQPVGSAEGLLAIFNESTARDFSTAGSRGSAWGERGDNSP